MDIGGRCHDIDYGVCWVLRLSQSTRSDRNNFVLRVVFKQRMLCRTEDPSVIIGLGGGR